MPRVKPGNKNRELKKRNKKIKDTAGIQLKTNCIRPWFKKFPTSTLNFCASASTQVVFNQSAYAGNIHVTVMASLFFTLSVWLLYIQQIPTDELVLVMTCC